MLIVIVFYLPTLVLARIGHSKQSLCLDEIKSGTLSLGCPHNQLIKLGRVFYGYSWSNDCSYIEKDCTMDVPREDIICLTTTNCTVRVVEHPLILQDCWNLAASYVQAEYECIAEYSLQNVCQPQDTTLSYGFISTPSYPNGFSSNLNCPCALFAPSGHAIVFEVIDFRLPTCAEAGLILWLGQDFQTKCLTQDPLTVVSNVQQNVTLRFYTLANIKHGGFLIKYSVLPVSNNATVRLQCYLAPAVSRPPGTTDLPTPMSAIHAAAEIGNSNNRGRGDEINMVTDQGGGLSPLLTATHPNDLIKRFPSGQDGGAPPILGTLEEHKDVLTLAGVNKQQPLSSLNSSMYRKYLFPNTASIRRSNMTLIVICAVAAVIFLLIMINALIWFIFSLRPRRSKSTTSFQNLYPHQMTSDSETKSPSSFATPLYHHHQQQHRRQQQQQQHQPYHHSHSSRIDDSSTISHHLPRSDPILPQTSASNRLRTLRSLIFRGHKTLGIDPITINHQRDLDSTLSEYHIRSASQSIIGPPPPLPKSRYEEQEDCVELKSEHSALSNRRRTLIKPKSVSPQQQEPRQINSWDDI